MTTIGGGVTMACRGGGPERGKSFKTRALYLAIWKLMGFGTINPLLEHDENEVRLYRVCIPRLCLLGVTSSMYKDDKR